MCNKFLRSSRFKIGLLGATACSLIYTLRVNVSVAIVAMVNETLLDDKHPEDMCSELYNQTNTNSYPNGNLNWSLSQQGVVLGSYFYGFTATNIFGGRFSERWGAKWVCAIGIMIPAIANALSPLAAQNYYIAFIAIRIIIGAFHGLIYSSLFSMYAKWFPKQERTAAIAATLFGGNIGAAIMSPLAGYLCEFGFSGGWPSVFYISSAIHVIWFIFWCYYAYDTPADHQNMSPDEHIYILQNIESQSNKSAAPAPWTSILTSLPVYATVFAKTTGKFGFFVLSTNLPSYFHSIFEFNLSFSGLYIALLYLAVGLTFMAAGPLSTCVKNYFGFSLTNVRKSFQILASLGPAICLALVPVVKCNLTVVLTLIFLSMCFYGFITGGEYPIIHEFAPEFSGTVFGFSNTFGSSTGFLAPIIVGIVLNFDGNQTGTRKEWDLVFYITAAVYLFGLIFFLLFASAERQSWAKLPENYEIELTEPKFTKKERNREIYRKKSSIKAFFMGNNIMGNSFLNKKTNTDTPEWTKFKKRTYVL